MREERKAKKWCAVYCVCDAMWYIDACACVCVCVVFIALSKSCVSIAVTIYIYICQASAISSSANITIIVSYCCCCCCCCCPLLSQCVNNLSIPVWNGVGNHMTWHPYIHTHSLTFAQKFQRCDQFPHTNRFISFDWLMDWWQICFEVQNVCFAASSSHTHHSQHSTAQHIKSDSYTKSHRITITIHTQHTHNSESHTPCFHELILNELNGETALTDTAASNDGNLQIDNCGHVVLFFYVKIILCVLLLKSCFVLALFFDGDLLLLLLLFWVFSSSSFSSSRCVMLVVVGEW